MPGTRLSLGSIGLGVMGAPMAGHLARVRPLLDVMGRAVFHLGSVRSGHAMKCLNNLVTAITFAATAEVLVIGKRYGLDPAAMVEVLNASPGQRWLSGTEITPGAAPRA